MECPVCNYQSKEPLLRCPDCRSIFPAAELEELYHLKYLQGRLESWREQGLAPDAIADMLQTVSGDVARLEGRLVEVSRPSPAAAEAFPSPPSSEAAPAQPAVTERPAVFTAPAPLPSQREVRPARPPREPFSWAKVGDALLSRRTLQTFLYLGATLLVLSAIILVANWWGNLHWTARQVILLAGMAALFWSGYQVREKMGLRLSGGALMDIGALWAPLNIGALLFEFLELRSDAPVIPGIGVPLGLPMAGWMAIAAVSAPVYAFLAYRFRLALMVYGAAIGASAALLTGLAALGAALEWQLAAVMLLAPAYLWIASALRRREAPELATHLFWLAQAAMPSLLVTVAGLVIFEDGSQWALTVALWAAALFYGVSWWWHRLAAFECLTALGLPLALLVTLAMHAPGMPLAWYNLLLAGLALVYALAGRYVLRSPLWVRTEAPRPAPALAGVYVAPLYVAALLLSLVAAIWPFANVPSAMASLYALVVVYGASACLFRRPELGYVAAFLLFAPFALTLHWWEVGPHWQALLFAPLAIVYLAAAELDAARYGERKLPMGQLLNPAKPVKALYARPLFLAGYAATLVAVIFAGVELTRGAYDFESLVDSFVGADPAPWTYLLAAAIYAVSAYLRRSAIFASLAALAFLPFALLLAERGFYAGLTLQEADYYLLVGSMSLVYLALGAALDRIPGHYAKPLYLAGYILTLAGMLGTIQVKEYNLAMVSMAAAVYAASAYYVHRGGHPSFHWLVEQIFPYEIDRAQRVIARGVFLYLATGLFPAAILLAISFAGPAAAWYGVALAAIGAVYLVIAESFRYSEPAYRYQWYAFGISLSAAGPAVALADPTLRIVTLGISTARFAASAAITRQPLWAYPVAALLPVLLVMSLLRFDVPVSYFGVALLSLAAVYGASGLFWPSDSLKLLGRPRPNQAGSYTLPFLAIGFLLSVIGVGLSALESREIIVAALGLTALFYLLATIALRQTALLYPAAFLLVAAYSIGLTLTGVDPQYYGLALLPGVAAMLAVGLALEGYPDQYRLLQWFWRREPDSLERPDPKLSPFAPMLPFCLTAYAGNLAVPILSVGDGWLFFWALAAAAVIYVYSAWRFRSSLWGYPGLLAAHTAFVQLLFLLSPGLPWNWVGVYLIPVVFLLAGLGVWVWRRKTKDEGRRISPPSPFFSFAMLGAIFSTALASIESSTGLLAGLAYSAPLAVGASVARRQALAWASMLFLSLSLGQGMRLAQMPLIDAPIYIALAGVALVIGSYVVNSLRRGVGAGLKPYVST